MPTLHLPVFLIHGLRGNSEAQKPLENKLRRYGFEQVHRIGYPSLQLSLRECRDHIAQEIKERLTDPESEIIIIAHSLGGYLSRDLHEYGFKIHTCFMVTAPQRGSYLAQYMKKKLKPSWANFLLGVAGSDLTEAHHREVPITPPPFNYWTIGASLPFSRSFDGVVFCENMMIEEDRHVHFNNSFHSIVLLDSRVHRFILEKLGLIEAEGGDGDGDKGGDKSNHHSEVPRLAESEVVSGSLSSIPVPPPRKSSLPRTIKVPPVPSRKESLTRGKQTPIDDNRTNMLLPRGLTREVVSSLKPPVARGKRRVIKIPENPTPLPDHRRSSQKRSPQKKNRKKSTSRSSTRTPPGTVYNPLFRSAWTSTQPPSSTPELSTLDMSPDELAGRK